VNLVCFPHYTCGGLFCDILNKESSKFGNSYNIESFKHSIGKAPPKNYYNGTGFDKEVLYNRTLYSNENRHGVQISPESKHWLGSHCWPGEFDTSLYDNIILITTENERSKLYRYARVFYTMIAGKYPLVSKPKRPADIQSYKTLGYQTVVAKNIYNLEFEDVVDWKQNVEELLLQFTGKEFIHHMYRRRDAWKQVNNFLFDERLDYVIKEWQSTV
jgi:hypothetical protein